MKNYMAIILFINNLMVWEKFMINFKWIISGKKEQKLHINYVISYTLKVCISLPEVFLY